MNTRYDPLQHDRYLRMTKEIGEVWMEVFENEPELYSAQFWDLFVGLYENRNRKVKKTDAHSFIKYTSSITAKKFIDKAIELGYVEETVNPRDARSQLLRMTPKLREKMERVFDHAVHVAIKAVYKIEEIGTEIRAS